MIPFDLAALMPIALLLLALAAAPLWSGLIEATTARVRGYRGTSIRHPYGELVSLLRRTDGGAPGWLPTLALAATAAATLQVPKIVAVAPGVPAGLAAGFILPFVTLSLLARLLLVVAGVRCGSTRLGETFARELLRMVTVEPTLLLALLAAAISTTAESRLPMSDAAIAIGAVAFALAAWTTSSHRPLWDPSPSHPNAGLLDGTAGLGRFPLELALHLRQLTLWVLWIMVFVPLGSRPTAFVATPVLAGLSLVAKLVALALAIALAEAHLVKRELLRIRELPAVALALAVAGLALALIGRSAP